MIDEPLVRTTIRIPRRLHTDLKKEASERLRTIEDLVRTAVEHELSGPYQHRFMESAHGDERRLLRELERDLQRQLEKIRVTLSGSETQGHEILMQLADRFLECLPIPALIRGDDGDFCWTNPAFSAALDDARRSENLAALDEPPHRQERVVFLYEKKISTPQHPAGDEQKPAGFLSLHFTFKDADGKLFTGELLLPQDAVQPVLRGQGVLMPVPSPAGGLAQMQDSQNTPSLLLCQAAFLEALPVACVIKDLGGRYQWANTAMLDEAQKSWDDVVGKRLVEWWSPSTDAPALARQVDEQEELVKAKRTGYLVPTGVTDDVSRIGLRFPLLDAQQRINYVGTIAFGPAILYAKLQPAERVEREA